MPSTERIKHLLEKPLIIGASVSADWSSLSPGKKLALRHTPKFNIRTLAQGGRMGKDTVRQVAEQDLADRSSVIGVDLFFWDSTQSDLKASLAALDDIVKRTEERDLPLVLGEIPELLPGRQPGRPTLNRAISEHARRHPAVTIMPFDQLHHQLMRDGFLRMKGLPVGLKEIVPDGLHLSDLAGDYLADVLQAVLTGGSIP